MVNLPKVTEQEALEARRLMFECCQCRFLMRRGTYRLLDLEDMATNATLHMRGRTLFNFDNQQLAMNRLRQILNLEFKLICHACNTAHYQDEVTAPER